MKNYKCIDLYDYDCFDEHPRYMADDCCLNCKHLEGIDDGPGYTDWWCNHAKGGWVMCPQVDTCDAFEEDEDD